MQRVGIQLAVHGDERAGGHHDTLISVLLVLGQVLEQSFVKGQGATGADFPDGIEAGEEKEEKGEKGSLTGGKTRKGGTYPTVMASAEQWSDTKLLAIARTGGSRTSGGT